MLTAYAAAAAAHGLTVNVALTMDSATPIWVHERGLASAFSVSKPVRGDVLDPRHPSEPGEASLGLQIPDLPELLDWWTRRLDGLRRDGARRFVVLGASYATRRLCSALRQSGADIEIANPDTFVALRGSHAPEHERRAAIVEAAARCSGWLMEAGFETGLADAVRAANGLIGPRGAGWRARARRIAGVGALGKSVYDWPDQTLLLVSNRGSSDLWCGGIEQSLDGVGALLPVSGLAPVADIPSPFAAALFDVAAPPAVRVSARRSIAEAAQAPRIVIADLTPSVDGGAYPIKRVVGERVELSVNIFADGHEALAAHLIFRAEDETDWRRTPLAPGVNDGWTGAFSLERLGRHVFAVEAWLDVWGGFVRDLLKKRDAELDLSLEIREGLNLVGLARDRATASTSGALADVLAQIDPKDAESAVERLVAHDTRALMAEADDRPFRVVSHEQTVEVERTEARFASWYELFPRSLSPNEGQHGTLIDVIGRLPHIAAMGFDTLYFPPIHPIGQQNRKGPNNSLTADSDDVGSPYAIGSAEGGHETIHPRLGSLSDFQELVSAARGHGIEIALDFAVQCAPDHPWLKDHPGWFAWRPDGSIKYAENPPKKYQDIVNVDFYGPDAVPGLWGALRDVVLFWAGQGVRAFRVDNPHTKPLPFWEWLIAETKARHPDLIFLAEAFTRPSPMYQLAKIGFSQSYSYFTWRNNKSELTAYLDEIANTPVREYYRPHFFVNTPDINPYFLQTSGRAGFLIRAALAATLSGLFGVYSGFELCEAAALPGREEYLDSEKYQLRRRPERVSGDIVDEIAQLNAIRRAEPALQTHLDVRFHNAFNEQILYYSKGAPTDGRLILTAVNLDPQHPQECDFEVPLWLFELGDDQSVQVEDLLTGRRFQWSGKGQHLRLTPERPYAIWRISPMREA